MDRRQLLRTMGMGGVTPLAGCVNPFASSTFLPGEVHDVDAGETHVQFSAPDGAEKLTVALLYHQAKAMTRRGEPLPFAVSFNPEEGVDLTRIKLEIRSPPSVSSTTLPAVVHLKAPEATSFPQLNYFADPTRRFTTIVEVPEFGSEHQGSALSFQFLVQPVGGEPPHRIRVAVHASLSESGGLSKQQYNALGQASIEITDD